MATSGYVYLIGNRSLRWYKIGLSIKPNIRIKNIGILLPFPIEVICVWRTSDCRQLESFLHEKYRDQQINGEWFEFNPTKIRELLSRPEPQVQIDVDFQNPVALTVRVKKKKGIPKTLEERIQDLIGLLENGKDSHKRKLFRALLCTINLRRKNQLHP